MSVSQDLGHRDLNNKLTLRHTRAFTYAAILTLLILNNHTLN